ncbi:hypothetical protein DL98DRAFT_575208 [Cadophora sp. DSE1049]|nr:hypothetical protein DL98DRAFT_575208 [Cadophora sp. DSE1049]
MSGLTIMMESPPISGAPASAYGTVPRATKHLGSNLQKELETLKERNKEDKRLKEKFPHINGEPTWLLRHIELLQEAYAKDGWEYDIEIPEECQHRIRPSIIGSYLIFIRDKNLEGRKGKVTKEYIPVPLSNGALWGTWKPMDDDARPPTEGRLPYLPVPAPGEAKLYHGLLDHELDAYLTAGEDPEDYEEYTIDGMGVLPEDRPPRRRIVSKGSSSSASSAKVSTYSSSSFNTAQTSAPSQSIMNPANFAPDRSLRSTRKVSNISASSGSTNNSSTSSTSLMSNGMPVPGSIRKPKYGERSDSEGLEGGSDNGEEDEEDEEDDEGHDQEAIQRSLNGQNGHYRIIRNSDDEDEDEHEDEEEDEYAVKPVSRNKSHRDAADFSGAQDGRAVSAKSASNVKKILSDIPDIGPYIEGEYGDEAGSDEDEIEVEYEEGNMAGGYDVEEGYGEDEYGEDGYGEAVEDYEDDEWFDESGYCKFCDLHQHECECIRGDENDPMERGEDDDDYKN